MSLFIPREYIRYIKCTHIYIYTKNEFNVILSKNNDWSNL